MPPGFTGPEYAFALADIQRVDMRVRLLLIPVRWPWCTSSAPAGFCCSPRSRVIFIVLFEKSDSSHEARRSARIAAATALLDRGLDVPSARR
jgi:hypothetical protein